MDGEFTYEAGFVVGGNTSNPSSSSAYSSVVSRDSVIIIFLIAALKELYISAYDIGTAYLNHKY